MVVGVAAQAVVPSCSKKISASRGPRFIFNSNNPSNPSNDGHQASLIDQNTITLTELLFLLPHKTFSSPSRPPKKTEACSMQSQERVHLSPSSANG